MTKAKYKRKCLYCNRYIPVCELTNNYGRCICKDKKECLKHRKITTIAGAQPAENEDYWLNGKTE